MDVNKKWKENIVIKFASVWNEENGNPEFPMELIKKNFKSQEEMISFIEDFILIKLYDPKFKRSIQFWKDKLSELKRSNSMEILEVLNTNSDIVLEPDFFEDIELRSNDKKGFICYLGDRSWNFEQTKDVSRAIYKNTSKKLVFPLTPSFKTEGKVISLLYPNKQKINLLTEYTYISYKRDVPIFKNELVFIGDKPPRVEPKNKKFISYDYFIYNFLSNGVNYYLLSDKKLSSFVRVEGLLIEASKQLNLESNNDITGRLNIIIATHCEELDKAYTFEEFREFLAKYSLEDVKQTIFRQYRHPEEYEELILSTLFSSSFSEYALPLFIIGKPKTGKTKLASQIIEALGESNNLLTGDTGTTLRGLIPSFANNNKPKVGYFLESNRVCVVDEFLNLLSKIHTKDRGNTLTQLNSLLLPREGVEARSGYGGIEFKSTARFIAFTNPKYMGKNIINLIDAFEGSESFWSRLLIYFQSNQHWEYIKKNTFKVPVGKQKQNIPTEKFIRMYEYLTKNQIIIDDKVSDWINIVTKKYEDYIPEKAKAIYGRYNEHLLRILDGVVKLRILRDGEIDYNVKHEDKLKAEGIFANVIMSWDIDVKDINRLPYYSKLRFLTEKARTALDELNKDFNGVRSLKSFEEQYELDAQHILWELNKLKLAKVSKDLTGEALLEVRRSEDTKEDT